MKKKKRFDIEFQAIIMLLIAVILVGVGLYITIENSYLRVIVSVAVPIILSIPAYVVIRRAIRKAKAVFKSATIKKDDTEETMRAIMNASPLCCNFWDKNMRVIDCNEAAIELFGYKDKQEYLDRWIFECNPECQPNGQPTNVMGPAILERVLAEGKEVVNWMHRLPDGTPVPTEVTFVRIKTGDDYFIAGYTRDLRREKALEERAGELRYDGTTGAYTRTYLEDKLARLIKILSRSSGEMSVIMISIDFIEKYYDSYGKSAGDRCVKTVTDILNKYSRRADDFTANYRDGDFVIVLPGTGQVGVQLIAQNLVDEMRKINIPFKKNTVASHVTLSMGVTTGKVFHRQRAEDYLRRAEEMLYISKQCGRNRFTWAEL